MREASPDLPLAAMDAISDERISILGHSKAGGGLTQICEARPERVSHFVHIELPPWLQALIGAPGICVTTLEESLRYYAALD